MKRHQLVLIIESDSPRADYEARSLMQRVLGVACVSPTLTLAGWQLHEVSDGEVKTLAQDVPEPLPLPLQRDPARVLGVPSLPGAAPPPRRKGRR